MRNPTTKPEVLNSLKVTDHSCTRSSHPVTHIDNVYIYDNIIHFDWIFSYGIWSRAQITLQEGNIIDFRDKGGNVRLSFEQADYDALPNTKECLRQDFNYTTLT